MSFCATYDDDNKTREFKHSVVFTDLINKICDFDVAKDELQQFFDTYNKTLETDITDESFKRNLAYRKPRLWLDSWRFECRYMLLPNNKV